MRASGVSFVPFACEEALLLFLALCSWWRGLWLQNLAMFILDFARSYMELLASHDMIAARLKHNTASCLDLAVCVTVDGQISCVK